MCNVGQAKIKNLIAKIKTRESAELGGTIAVKDAILYQKELMKHNFPKLPTSFIEFLHSCNAVSYDGAKVFGISPKHKNFLDIIKENSNNKLTQSQKMIVLGYDAFDYLAYNQEKSNYQIIDKQDLEVLEEYNDLELALLYILKI